MVTEHGSATHGGVFDGLLEVTRKSVTVENVVAKHEGARLAGDELLTDSEGLSEAIRRGLLSIRKVHAVARTVPEQALKIWKVCRCRDDQNVPNARQHKGGQRIVDHGLVIDRQQLLGGHERERVQTRARSASEDDAFHIVFPPQSKLVIKQAVSKTLLPSLVKPSQY